MMTCHYSLVLLAGLCVSHKTGDYQRLTINLAATRGQLHFIPTSQFQNNNLCLTLFSILKYPPSKFRSKMLNILKNKQLKRHPNLPPLFTRRTKAALIHGTGRWLLLTQLGLGLGLVVTYTLSQKHTMWLSHRLVSVSLLYCYFLDLYKKMLLELIEVKYSIRKQLCVPGRRLQETGTTGSMQPHSC